MLSSCKVKKKIVVRYLFLELQLFLHRVLEVSPIASAAEIKSAYRQMALKYHPDKAGGLAGSSVLFKLVARAYDILSDPEKKRLYDNSIRNRVHKPFYGGH